MKHVSKIIPGVLEEIKRTQKERYLKLYQKYDGNFEKMSKLGNSKRTAEELAELAVFYNVKNSIEGVV